MENVVNACIEFTNGKKINLELYPDVAPLSVENFVTLAKEGFYEGLCFHRVIPNFMIQGGGFEAKDGALTEKRSVRTVKGEFKSNGVENNLKHEPGVISMARTQVKDSATSQFFICVASVPYLDGEYAAFGKAVDAESIDVAVQISKVPTGSYKYYDDVPVKEIVIKKVVVG